MSSEPTILTSDVLLQWPYKAPSSELPVVAVVFINPAENDNSCNARPLLVQWAVESSSGHFRRFWYFLPVFSKTLHSYRKENEEIFEVKHKL